MARRCADRHCVLCTGAVEVSPSHALRTYEWWRAHGYRVWDTQDSVRGRAPDGAEGEFSAGPREGEVRFTRLPPDGSDTGRGRNPYP